jgi:signal transduction histidine kinase
LATVTAAVFLLTYRLTELDMAISPLDSGRLLARLYVATFVLICVGAWWIVLAQESRELAERDLVTSLEKLTETRQELMQSERLAAIGQLMATVSHELRNPLGTLVSSMTVLRRYLGAPSPLLGEEIDRMQRNIWRCVSIIEELLEFSRNRDVELRPVRIDDWIATQLAEYEVADWIRLETRLGSGAVVLIDGARLRQALINVLQNAQQAIVRPENGEGVTGEITVGTSETGGEVELRITDNGGGIAAENRDKLFKPLFSTKAYGVGLGLPLVRRIVEQHRGRIDVASQWRKGTTVTIRLPLASPTAAVEHDAPARAPASASIAATDAAR